MIESNAKDTCSFFLSIQCCPISARCHSIVFQVWCLRYHGSIITSDAFSNLCAFTQGWSGVKKRESRGLSGPKPGPLLPTGRRDGGISRSLVAGWFTANYHIRSNIWMASLQTTLRTSRVLEKISPSRRVMSFSRDLNCYSTILYRHNDCLRTFTVANRIGNRRMPV